MKKILPQKKVSKNPTQTPRSKKMSEEQAVKDAKIGKTKGIGKNKEIKIFPFGS